MPNLSFNPDAASTGNFLLHSFGFHVSSRRAAVGTAGYLHTLGIQQSEHPLMSEEISHVQAISRKFMELAIEEMQKSTDSGPKVGAVIVLDDQIVATGHRSNGLHAERIAIESAQSKGIKLHKATLYTTLEPCIPLNSNIEACAPLIVSSGIKTVYIGRYDTHPSIYREGWRHLRDAKVHLLDFDADLRLRIDEINEQFVEHFVSGIGPIGGAKFDYLLNGGNFEIQFSNTDERKISTRWTRCGHDSIYACAVQPVRVALARHAKTFSEIHDPRAFDFNYYAQVKINEIAVFVTEFGAALVKIIEVHSGSDYGSDHTSVKIKYEIRAWDNA